jgi:hypothetical protein
VGDPPGNPPPDLANSYVKSEEESMIWLSSVVLSQETAKVRGPRLINGQPPGLGTPIRAYACQHITGSSNLRQIL